ncbi:MAG: DUF4180 domain-containing protein [Oscillospiraceae bacterium]|jgi:hypothetical protein|nr:DUF4180 domain-containing protein [Oscillospiraceae bacterium]
MANWEKNTVFLSTDSFCTCAALLPMVVIDYIYECNRGKHLYFVDNEETATQCRREVHAAVGYDCLEPHASESEYEAVAEEVCADYTAALRAVAAPNEPNPAKCKWNC